MIVRNLVRRKMRTLLTLLGIAVGIAAIVTLVALSRGIVTNYVEVSNRSSADLTLQAVQDEGQAITLGTGFDASLADRLRTMPEVKNVSGMIYTFAQVPGVPFFIIYGYEPDQVAIRRFKIVEGVTLADHRTRRGGKPILIGRVAADKLNKGIGDTVRLEETTFRVVGIYETGAAMEDSAGVISLQDAQVLANMPHQVMYLGLQLHQPDRADAFRTKLERLLPPDVEVAGSQAGDMMLEMLELLDVYAWGVALIAALVGGVGMMNTMLMSVFERTREIGVLRAVGWSRWRVLRMIMGEALVLSLLGGGLGLGVGAGLTWLLAHTPAMEGMTRDTVPAELVVQALSTALVLGTVGGVYPAWRASRLSPVEALSYDGGSRQRNIRRIRLGGMAVKNLLRQRTRTVLTLVGVGIGILAMLLMGAVTEGTLVTFDSLFSGTELSAVERDQPDTSMSVIDERILKRVEALPEVEYVSGSIFAVVSTAQESFFVVMARERTDPALKPAILKEGKLLTGPNQCLLGWKAAAQHRKQVGDRMSMFGTSFKVVGIIEMGNTYEDNGATIDLREAQVLMKKPRQVMMMQIKLKDPSQTDRMVERLSQEYPKLLFSRSAELAESLPDMQSSRQSMGAILVLTAFVGSIALMNTMIMSIHERTREIGVLRAVGWRRGLVLAQVLAESLILTILSGTVGLLVTLALIKSFSYLPSMGFARDLFVLTPNTVLQALALCIILGMVGGLYPAWRATRFSPVEALRYE